VSGRPACSACSAESAGSACDQGDGKCPIGISATAGTVTVDDVALVKN
jgi:hypothetical protein